MPESFGPLCRIRREVVRADPLADRLELATQGAPGDEILPLG
jgi:hypothetical protein